MTAPVFRFAPSPTGYLHIGHAYSALLNADLAARAGGCVLVRIEDIDVGRCRPEYVDAIFEDLHWLGLQWAEPVRRQSEHFARYRQAADRLREMRLIYPCFATRGEIVGVVAEREAAGEAWPRDPDGSPLYPGIWRGAAPAALNERMGSGEAHAWRLDMAKALKAIGDADLDFMEYPHESAERTVRQSHDPAVWGDVVILRKEAPASYHLASVVDDHLQGITDVVRGREFAEATGLHRLLQVLLGYDPPRYRHHRLITDETGRKLSKSDRDTNLRELRAQGVTAAQVRARVGM